MGGRRRDVVVAWVGVLVTTALGLGVATPAVAAPHVTKVGVWPVAGPVARAYDPPEVAWGAGHRGVDLAAHPGDEVRAPRDGTVSYAGRIAGRPVLVVDHGGVRTTLEPVEGVVPVGTSVAAGQVVGRLVAGHACPAEACLHWGVKRGEEYLDPLGLVTGPPRLLPDSAVAAVERRAAERERAAAAVVGGLGHAGGSGVLEQPAAGRLTSGFGPRLHPIFGTWRLHAGVDISAPCGTPLHAAADGVVSHMGYDASGGWRLVLDHGSVGGVRLSTVYLHAEGYRVRAGDRVVRGEVVGSMGTTGWSTGCHLHFGVKADGVHVDPERWLG